VVTARLAKVIGADFGEFAVEPYSKGGYVVEWTRSHNADSADGLIVEVLRLSEALASRWTLHGSVDDELEGLVSRTGAGRIAIAGVTMLTWHVSTVHLRQ